jgi:hypothetical protein
MKVHRNQGGAALILLVFVLSLVMTAYLLHTLDSTAIQNDKNRKTAQALSQAKQALLGYAASADLSSTSCALNCPRPGDLPCPDTNNDGVAESSCSGSVIGRLPWKTLGLPDLRDGEGERLWYAVSSRYKKSPRVFPLNSDTAGTITLRDAKNNFLYNGTSDGLAAVVIAPGSSITRQDSITQVRDAANQNNAVNYLDIAFGEDNQNFVDGNTNGFIAGPIKNAAGATILNDQVIGITRDEMNQVMENRVLGEVSKEFRTYYYSSPGARFYPNPADFTDASCLGYGDLSAGSNCQSKTGFEGRIPTTPPSSYAWDTNSVLRGGNLSNWFQQNAWREVIYYSVTYKCISPGGDCANWGNWLTLNNALVTPTDTKKIILIASGKTLSGQARGTNLQKTTVSNYLESENATTGDSVFVRTQPFTPTINDRVVSLP